MLSPARLPGRTTPSSFTAAALGPAHAHGELKTGLLIAAESGWGPHDWSVLSPTVVHRDGGLPHCTLSPLLGACVGPGSVHGHGGSTPGS
jgi:hypothetical protein